jgi:hypothetical protein
MLGPDPAVCVLYTARIGEVLPLLPGASVLARSGNLTLLTNGR